jgi:hypothetical protein
MRITSAAAVWLAATLLSACGSGVASSSTKLKFDARWSALQSCLTKEEQGTVETVIHPRGSVRTVSPGHLRIFAPDGWVAAITYEGTFARAEAQAKRTKAMYLPIPPGTGAGFAVGNVAYYFTTFLSSPQFDVVTGCLGKTDAGQPKWAPHTSAAPA